jgi:hypothetical protein
MEASYMSYIKMKFNSNIIFEKWGLRGFYHIVYLAMILSVTGALYSLFVSWHLINIGQRISSIMGLIIQSLFTFFFKWLRDTAPQNQEQKKSELKSTDDMVKIMQGGIENEKPIQEGGKESGGSSDTSSTSPATRSQGTERKA